PRTTSMPIATMAQVTPSRTTDTAADSGLVLNRMPSHSFLGKVFTERLLRKIEATDSSNERSIANRAPTPRPGRSKGKTIVRKTRQGFAPRLAAARDSQGSMELYAADATR